MTSRIRKYLSRKGSSFHKFDGFSRYFLMRLFYLVNPVVLHTIVRAYQGGVEENCVVMTGKVPPV